MKSSEYLSNIIDKNKKIGIGWNETLYNISIELKYNDADKQKIFYPLIGNLRNNNNPYLQINTIVAIDSLRNSIQKFILIIILL